MGKYDRNTHKLKTHLHKTSTVSGLKWRVLLKNNGGFHERRFCARKDGESAQVPFCRGTNWP